MLSQGLFHSLFLIFYSLFTCLPLDPCITLQTVYVL
jgi:hypothetical protein